MTDFSQGVAYVDGQFVSMSKAKISLLDWGFLHSDATYDVAYVWKGKFFRLDDHIERFFSSMEKLQMSIPHSRSDLHSILVDCVRAGEKNKGRIVNIKYLKTTFNLSIEFISSAVHTSQKLS